MARDDQQAGIDFVILWLAGILGGFVSYCVYGYAYKMYLPEYAWMFAITATLAIAFFFWGIGFSFSRCLKIISAFLLIGFVGILFSYIGADFRNLRVTELQFVLSISAIFGFFFAFMAFSSTSRSSN